jgi:hypothetical protein
MIVNGFMYTEPSAWVGFTKGIVVVGLITGLVVQICLSNFFLFGVFFFLHLWRQSKNPPPPLKEKTVGDAQNVGWLTRILDEMALGAFAFGTADALKKRREDRKR